jgi:hypothetical protein
MIRCCELILFDRFVYYLRLHSVKRWKYALEGSNHGLFAVLCRHFMEGLKNTMEFLCKYIWCHGRNSNPLFLKYESRALTDSIHSTEIISK